MLLAASYHTCAVVFTGFLQYLCMNIHSLFDSTCILMVRCNRILKYTKSASSSAENCMLRKLIKMVLSINEPVTLSYFGLVVLPDSSERSRLEIIQSWFSKFLTWSSISIQLGDLRKFLILNNFVLVKMPSKVVLSQMAGTQLSFIRRNII